MIGQSIGIGTVTAQSPAGLNGPPRPDRVATTAPGAGHSGLVRSTFSMSAVSAS